MHNQDIEDLTYPHQMALGHDCIADTSNNKKQHNGRCIYPDGTFSWSLLVPVEEERAYDRAFAKLDKEENGLKAAYALARSCDHR